MRSNKGLAGKRTRYIKQNLDEKGRIKKSSRVVEGYDLPKNYMDITQIDKILDEIIESDEKIKKFIISTIIVVIIVLLIMWR